MRTAASYNRDFGQSKIPAANVSSVPQRSPLRYPGGKTWLVPHIRAWLDSQVPLLIEPFAGGGIVSLTAVMEMLAEQALMVELDRNVSSFWRAALEHSDELIERIRSLKLNRARIEDYILDTPKNVVDDGFRTLVLNRTRRAGILAPGAALIKRGENNAGVSSRWYPETLIKRLKEIAKHSDRLRFCEGDGVEQLELQCEKPNAAFFIDPPYTAKDGKRAGIRLYTHNTVDHLRIFEILADSGANFMMTYECSPEITSLVRRHGFQGAIVEIKTSHHRRIPELIITRDKLFT